MSSSIESSTQTSRAIQSFSQSEEEKRERERLSRLRSSQPLAEEPLRNEPRMGDDDGSAPASEMTMVAAPRQTAHVQSLDLRLEEHMPSSPQQAVSFAVRAALEMMWDDISEIEERTARITRQAHLAMLMARIKSRSR